MNDVSEVACMLPVPTLNCEYASNYVYGQAGEETCLVCYEGDGTQAVYHTGQSFAEHTGAAIARCRARAGAAASGGIETATCPPRVKTARSGAVWQALIRGLWRG